MADDLRQMLVLAASRQDSAFERMEKGEKPELATDDASFIISRGIGTLGIVASLYPDALAACLEWQEKGTRYRRLLELLDVAVKEPDAVPPDAG